MKHTPNICMNGQGDLIPAFFFCKIPCNPQAQKPFSNKLLSRKMKGVNQYMATTDLANYKKFVKNGQGKSKSKKKVPIQPGSWLKNVTKSLGYASLETVGQLVPNITEYAKSAAEASEAVIDAVKSANSNVKNLQQAISGNDYVSLLKEFKTNAIQDLKTGNFYNKARRDKFISDQMGGDFDDMDFDFGDDDWETEGDFESTDEGASVSVKSAKKGETHVSKITMVNDIGPDSPLVQSTNYQTQVIAKGTEAMANTLISNNQALMTMMGKVGNDQVRAISTTTSTIADVGTQITSKLSELTSISEKYFNDSMAVANETRDLLKEIRANTSAAASATLAAREPKQVNDIMNLIGSGGVLSLSDYKAYVKANAKKWAESDFIASSIMSILSEKDTLRDMVQQPLKFMIDGVVNAAIPSMTKTVLKSLDETVGEFITTGLTQLGSLNGAGTANPLISAISQIFGMKQDMRTHVNKGNYNKGAVAFDGITHKTINEVIPTYLRQIAAVLTNREEVAFDYDRGVFRSVRDIEKEYKSKQENAILSPFSEDRAMFKKAIKESMTSASEDERKNMEKVMDTLLNRMVSRGGLENYRKVYDKHGNMRDPLAEILNMSSDSKEVILLRDFFEGRRKLPNGNAMNMRTFGSNVHAARRAISNLAAQMESDPYATNSQYINNGLAGYTNQHMRLPKEGEKSSVATPKSGGLGLDKYGKSSTDYLRSVLATLQKGLNVFVVNNTIPTPVSGGRRRKRGATGTTASVVSQFDYSKDKQKRAQELKTFSDYHSKTDRVNKKYEKEKEDGKINLDSEISEGQFESTIESALDDDYGDANTKNRKASFLEKMSGMQGTLGKWAGGLNKMVNKASGKLGTAVTAVDNFLYNLLFGDGKKNGVRYMIDIATSYVVNSAKKAFVFLSDKILKPIDTFLFGDNGLFTKLKESELFKNIKDRFSSAKDIMTEKIFGTKVEGADGTVTYEGGLLSSTANAFSAMGVGIRDAVLGKKGPDGKPLPPDKDHSAMGAMRRLLDNASNAIATKLGIGEKEDGSKVTFAELAVNAMDDVWNRIKERSSFLVDNLFGKPSKGENVNNARDLYDNFRTEMEGKGGFLAAGGILGAGTGIASSLGLVGSLWLPGGPIGGAILGAGIAFATQSETLKSKLFGPTDENGERTGGLITKDFQDFFKEHKGGLAAGGIAGLASSIGIIPSLFVPGGPIGGALIGTGLSMVAKSQYMSDLLYGPDGTKDDPTGGVLEKIKKIFGKDKDLKGLALDGAIGAGLGIVGSLFLPGGPIVGAVLGAATSIITNTESFKKFFFGEEQFDENGNSLGRKGGLIGRVFDTIDNKIVTPLFKRIEIAQADLMFFMKDKIFRNLAIAVGPITNKFVEAGEAVLDMSKALGSHVLETFKSIVIAPVGNAFDTYLIQPMKTLSSMIFKTFTKVLGGIISAPFKLIGAIGMSIFEHDKARGVKDTRSDMRSARNSDAMSKLAKGDILGSITSFARGTVDIYRPSTKRAAQFSKAGAGRYASATKNPETENTRIHNEALTERDRRYAEIEAKYGSGKPLTGRALRKAKKNDPNYTVSSKIEQANETADKQLTETQDINDTVSKLSNKFEESLSERRSFFDVVKNAFGRLGLGGITSRLRGDDSPQTEEGSPKDNTPGAGGKRRYKVSGLSKTPGITAAHLKDQEEALKAKEEVRQLETSKVEAASDNLKGTGKREGIFSYVRKISDNVDGNLNGVGYNINKIYALLLKEFKSSDDDIKGGDNKKYLGWKGRIVKWLTTPLRAVHDVIMMPFKIIGGLARGVKDTVTGLVSTVANAGKTLVKGIGGIGKALLSIPGQLLGIFGSILKTGLTVINETVKVGAKALTTAIKVGGEILVSGIKGIGNFVSGLAKGIGAAGGKLISGLSKLGEGIMSLGGSLLKGLGTLGAGLMKGLGFVIKGGGKLLGAGAHAVGSAVSGVAGALFGKKSGGILGTKVQKVYVVGGTIDKVKKVLEVNKVKATDLSSYINKMSSQLDALKAKFQSLGGRGGGFGGGFGEETNAVRKVYITGGKVDEIKEVSKVEEVKETPIEDGHVPGVPRFVEKFINKAIGNSAIDVTGKNTASSIIAERDAKEQAELMNAREDLQTSLLGKVARHTGSFAKEFNLIFGKNGLIGSALIIGIPLLINFLRNFNLSEIISSLTSSVADSFVGLFNLPRQNEGGGIAVDENGNPETDPETGEFKKKEEKKYAGGIEGYKQRAIDLFFPEKTRIQEDGSFAYERKWDNQSGALGMALGNRGLKWGLRAAPLVKGAVNGVTALGKGAADLIGKAGNALANTGLGKAIGGYLSDSAAYRNAVKSFTAAGIDDAAGMAAETVGRTPLAGKALSYVDDLAAKGSTAVAKGVEALKSTPIGKSTTKVVSGGKGIIQKFMTIAKNAIDDLVGAVIKFAEKHGVNSAALGPVQALFKKLSSVLSESVLAKYAKKIGTAVANFLAGLTPATVANVVFAGIGFINANPAQIFQVKSEDVDMKMQLIARFFKAALGTSFGTILDVLFEIANGMFGIDIGSTICVTLYNALAKDEDDKLDLEKARSEFKQQYEDAMVDEYEVYKQHATETGAPVMSYEDYRASELSTKFNEYNRETNQTIGNKIMNGVGGIAQGVKKGWTGLKSGVSTVVSGAKEGAKSFGSWLVNGVQSVGKGIVGAKDKAVNVVQEGASFVANGAKEIGSNIASAAGAAKDKAVEMKDKAVNVAKGIKETVGNALSPIFDSVSKGFTAAKDIGSIPSKIYTDIINSVKQGESMKDAKITLDENDTFYTLKKFLATMGKVSALPEAGIRLLGKKIYDVVQPIVAKVVAFGPKIKDVASKNWQQALSGERPSFDTAISSDDPTSYILGVADVVTGTFMSPLASVIAIGKKIKEDATAIGQFVANLVPRIGSAVGKNWHQALSGETPTFDTAVSPDDPTSYIVGVSDIFTSVIMSPIASIVTIGKKIKEDASAVIDGVKAFIPKVGEVVSSNWNSAKNGEIPAVDTAISPDDPTSYILWTIDSFTRGLFTIPAGLIAFGKSAKKVIAAALEGGSDIATTAKKAANIMDKNITAANYFKSGEDTSTVSGVIGDLLFRVIRGFLSPIWTLFKGISSITGVVSDGLKWLMEKVGIGSDVETTSSTPPSGGSGGRGGMPEQSKVEGGYGPDYVSQNDPSLANQPYNLSNGQHDTFGYRGCGPAAMTMVANKMGGNVSPLDVAKDSTRGGYSTDVGTRKEFFSAEASKLGMSSSRMPASAENMKRQLGGYGPVILQGQDNDPNSPFTSKGHYVVGNRVSNGMIDIDDPRGPQYSGLYPVDKVAKGATNMWAFGNKKKGSGGYGGTSDIIADALGNLTGSTDDLSTESKVTSGKAPSKLADQLGNVDDGKCSPRKVVKIAAGEVGYLEKNSGGNLEDKQANAGDNNYTKYNQIVGSNPQYWCAAFVSWVFDKACDSNPTRRNAVICGGISAACNSLMQNFKNAGRFDNNPKIGDMIFFPGSRHGGANHIGIVVGIKDNIVYTIEGNTSGGSGVVDNGDGVFVRSYQLPGTILGYGHPNWEAESPNFAGITSADQAAAAATMSLSGDSSSSASYSSSSSSSGSGLMGTLGSMASTLFGPLMEAFGLGSSATSGTDLSTVQGDSSSPLGNYTGIQITGNDTKESAFNFFRKLGYSAAAAAGILGNAENESGCDPTSIESHGKGPAAGFFQWMNYNTKSSRWKDMSDYAASKGKQWTDLQSQLEFADSEFKVIEPARWQYKNWVGNHWVDGERKANIAKTGIKVYTSLEDFKAADNPESAALSWQETFERPNFASSHWDKRAADARRFYDMYKDSTGGVKETADGNVGGGVATNKKGQPISPKDSDKHAADAAEKEKKSSTIELAGMGGYGGTPTVPKSSIQYNKFFDNGVDNTRYKPVTPKPDFDIQKFAASGGFGDTESHNLLGQIKGVLDTIAGNTGSIGSGIDSLNDKPVGGDTTNNITTVNNLGGSGDQKTDTKKHSFVDRTPKDRTGYKAAKKLASGVLLAT